MANIYGKPVYTGNLKVGTITISNPEHGALSTNKKSGFVGETITISSSMNTNYTVSYFTLNGTKISGSSFRLLEGENVVSCVESYSAPSANDDAVLTLKYYKNDTIDSNLTKTKTFSKNSFVNPSNYVIDITGYKCDSYSPATSFTITNDTTISYYYIEEKEYNPFDYITISTVHSVGSDNMTNGKVKFTLSSDAPFDYCYIDNADGGIVYYDYNTSEEVRVQETLYKGKSVYSEEWSFNGEEAYLEMELNATSSLSGAKTYYKTYSYGTKPSAVDVIVAILTYLDGDLAYTYDHYAKEGETLSMSSLINKYMPNTKSEYSSSNITTSTVVATDDLTIYIYYKTKDSSSDNNETTKTYYTLTVYHYNDDTLYTSETYQIEKGTVVKPSDYQLSYPKTGWAYESTRPSSSFTMSSNKSITIYYASTGLSVSLPALSSIYIKSGTYKLESSSTSATRSSASYSLTSGTASFTCQNTNSFGVAVYANSSYVGSLGANTNASFTCNVGSSGSISVYFVATNGSDNYSSGTATASVSTTTTKSITCDSNGSCSKGTCSVGVSGDTDYCEYTTTSGEETCCSNATTSCMVLVMCPVYISSCTWDSTITI